MKSLLILSLLISNLIFGQASWTLISSGTNHALHDIQFTSLNTGFIVGDSGTVLKTVDEGITWTNISIQNDLNLVGLSFLNDSIGYVISEHNLYKTLDGGLNWNLTFTDTVNNFLSIKFLNAQTGFIGSNGLILKTTDGALNWTSTYLSHPAFLSINFPSPNVGYFTGSFGGGVNVYKTINQGQSFTVHQILANTVIEEVYFINDSVGYLIGWYEPRIYKTIDGGQSWQNNETQNPGGQAVHFINQEFGFYIDNSSVSRINATLNGGLDWENELTLNISGIYTLQKICSNQKAIFAVGINGMIYKRNGVLSTSDKKSADELTLYPNPTQGVLNVSDLVSKSDRMEFVVYDMDGKQQLSGGVDDQKIDISTLPQGAYYIKLISEKSRKTYKVLKQ